MPEKRNAGAGEPGADLIGDWDAGMRKMSQSRCASRPNPDGSSPQGLVGGPLKFRAGGATVRQALRKHYASAKLKLTSYTSQSPCRLHSPHYTPRARQLFYREGDESMCSRRVMQVPGNPVPI